MRIIQSLAPNEALSELLIDELADWYDEATSKESTASDRWRKRITELQRLKAASYEKKLLGRIVEAT